MSLLITESVFSTKKKPHDCTTFWHQWLETVRWDFRVWKSDCKGIFLHSNIKKPARELMWLWRRRSIIIDDEKAHECVVVVCQTCLQVFFFLHVCVVKITIVIRVSSWTTVVFSNKNKQVTVYVENYGMSRVFYVLLKIVIANCCTFVLRWISCTWCEQTDSSL